MITADLDRELAAALRALTGSGVLPASAASRMPAGTWRPGSNRDPLSYATAAPFEVAGPAGLDAAEVAAAVADSLRAVPWIETAAQSGSGYLTITVSDQALAASAARMAAAGPGCATSTILRGTVTTVWPWPDLAAARSWQHAWRLQADAMIGRLAHAAGAAATDFSGRERASTPTQPEATTLSPELGTSLLDAVAYFGADSVRYRLARLMPGRPVRPVRPGSGGSDLLYSVQQAHADAGSTLRWAADLGLAPAVSADGLGRQLSSPAERALLSQLSFLPVRVAAAARRNRPDELPRYLEQVSESWLACRLQAPALPFGGQAAPRDPVRAAARLALAAATAAVIAAGLTLIGVAAPDRL